MTARKSEAKRVDPVIADQGGRMMPLDPTESPNAPREERVRRKAYEIFERRGRQHGRDFDDWLAAEAQVAS